MKWIGLLVLTLAAFDVLFALDAVGLWAAIGGPASGIVGMLLGCVVLVVWLEKAA